MKFTKHWLKIIDVLQLWNKLKILVWNSNDHFCYHFVLKMSANFNWNIFITMLLQCGEINQFSNNICITKLQLSLAHVLLKLKLFLTSSDWKNWHLDKVITLLQKCYSKNIFHCHHIKTFYSAKKRFKETMVEWDFPIPDLQITNLGVK